MKINMKLGVASSATQIEGGSLRHTWNDWHQKGRIHDGASPARATDHFHLWKEDIDLMADMGIQVYRLGIEWARLEPSKGCYDEAAAAWYRELLIYMKSKGIEPLLTLHHFTNPMWFEETGGFAEPVNIPVYLGFVEYAVKQFGDLVDEYVTINEPNVFSVSGYFQGVFPPGRQSLMDVCRVQSVMASCHIQAYGLIHKLRREMGYENTKVGFAHHARVVEPKSGNNPLHRTYAWLTEHVFQGAITRACLLGRFVFPLQRFGNIQPGEYADFLGLNYYSRSTVSKLDDGVREGSPRNDLDWEIYPEGIVSCAKKFYQLLPRPIYVTENGVCDNNDTFRCRFIYDHLQALCACDLPVEKYYHWCFTDNFEWAEGESARFGLVHVDFETQKRTLKKSGRFYAAIIDRRELTAELHDEYVAPQKYRVS